MWSHKIALLSWTPIRIHPASQQHIISMNNGHHATLWELLWLYISKQWGLPNWMWKNTTQNPLTHITIYEVNKILDWFHAGHGLIRSVDSNSDSCQHMMTMKPNLSLVVRAISFTVKVKKSKRCHLKCKAPHHQVHTCWGFWMKHTGSNVRYFICMFLIVMKTQAGPCFNIR